MADESFVSKPLEAPTNRELTDNEESFLWSEDYLPWSEDSYPWQQDAMEDSQPTVVSARTVTVGVATTERELKIVYGTGLWSSDYLPWGEDALPWEKEAPAVVSPSVQTNRVSQSVSS